ncbi:MFS transporter [Prauserella halophila]|uniref:MFS transporter n=1 Tax=Prauserella halophila TaxID=185641 RepID=A0ABN1WF16_9PSEU|nr:MFS transporter [Prauserella halophila]MCP2238129.1 MFS transporter, MHS family, proline/betaine transporter [Prauserella halophila]
MGIEGSAAAPAGTPAHDGRVPGKVTTAAVLGTVLEWYDFAIYAAMAPVVARLFFPADDPVTSLLVALASYAVGFVCRPLGSILFGRMGDRAGRRSMLAVTMVIVGVVSALIGLLPTYTTAGLLAPALLVALRMLQGLAVGAEWTGGATYLIEHARTGRRGLYSGIVQSSTVAGFLLGTGVVTVMTTALDESAIDSGWWRLPFLIGGVVAAVGVFVRLRLEDSPEFRQAQKNPPPATSSAAAVSLRRNWMLVFGSVFGLAILGYTVTSFPAYISGVTGLPHDQALVTNAIALVIEVPLIVIAGMLSDRVGRTRVMTAAMVGFAALVYPIFLMVASGSVTLVLIGQLLFVVLYAAASGPMAALFVELFPTRLRSAGFSTSYNVGVAVFGGTAPFVNTAVATAIGSATAPAFYLILGAVVSLLCLWGMPRRHDLELLR